MSETLLVAITLICPNLVCKKAMNVSEELRGQPVRCPHCQRVLVVPKKAAARPAPTGERRSPRR